MNDLGLIQLLKIDSGSEINKNIIRDSSFPRDWIRPELI
jgi:hypothetical protein